MPYKFKINPYHDSGDDTLCMALRRLWLEGRRTGNKKVMHEAEKSFDFAKRMDKRLKYYRAKYEPDRVGPEIARGHPDGED
jgi:hypothetical protein